MKISADRGRHSGFSYLEVIVALFILSIAFVPAMQAIQSGVQGTAIHQQLTQQQYAVISKMETVLADSFDNLLAAAKAAGDATTASSYSDPSGATNRVLVFIALYDADAEPFNISDPNNDGDSDVYTGDTANLLWLKVQLENTVLSYESLLNR